MYFIYYNSPTRLYTYTYYIPLLTSTTFRSEYISPPTIRLKRLPQEIGAVSKGTSCDAEMDSKSFWFCVCSLCNEFFDTKRLLDMHKIEIHHQPSCFIPHEVVKVENNFASCVVCKEEFSCPDDLVSHQRSEHVVTFTEILLENNADPNFLFEQIYTKGKSPERIYDKTYFDCEVCGEQFEQHSALIAHQELHIKPYKCFFCHLDFFSKRHLVVHQQIHASDLPYKCEVCDKRFAREPYLMVHMKKHTGDRPYKCGLCDKSYTRNIDLVTHHKTHTGDKPFKCGYCHKVFSVNQNLVRHERTHTGEKPFKCELCDKGFIQKIQLINHNITHMGNSPFKCNYCQQAFSTKQNLLRHIRRHTGDKPFKCEMCDKCFIQKSQLAVHNLTHTDSKPFKCNRCQKTFTCLSGLRKHERRNEGRESCRVFPVKQKLDSRTQ